MGLPLVFQAKYKAAREQVRKALELDPNFYVAHWALGWSDIEAGKFSAAIPEMEKARVTDSPPFVAGWLGYAYATAGERAKGVCKPQIWGVTIDAILPGIVLAGLEASRIEKPFLSFSRVAAARRIPVFCNEPLYG